MRAVAFSRYGSADVLEPVDLAEPAPSPGTVRVRVVAASVNPADWRLRSGQFRRFLRIRFPFVPGTDLAGVVEAVGDGVTTTGPGDGVFGVLTTRAGGAYAEHAVVPAGQLAPIPAGVTFAEAAAVPLCGLTALQALRDQGRLQAGNRVLVHGAGGGVGSLAVQIARALGAEVTAVTSRDKARVVRALGADEVLGRDADDLSALAGRFDVVLDTSDVVSNRRLLDLLRPGGTAVTVNPFRGKLVPDWTRWLRGGRRVRSVLVRERSDDLRALAGLLADGSLRAVLDDVLPLERAAEAHRRLESGSVTGKLVLAVDAALAASSPSRLRPDAA